MRRLLAVLVLAGALAGCGGGDEGAVPDGAFAFSANSGLAVGTERLLVALALEDGTRIADPEIRLSVSVWPEDDPGVVATADASFMWIVPDVTGLYRVMVPFDRPGTWRIEVTPDGGGPMESFPVRVDPDAPTPVPGDPAPASRSVTLAEAPLEEITTDPDPDPRLYEMSIADAVASGRPTVVVFATPRFCQTAVCGPVMETIRALAPTRPDVNWIHVEVYTNLDAPDDLELVPAVVEWGLQTEPWVFVVDEDGIVTARFEGMVTSEELEEALG
jgi:hypothetical protein